MVIWHTQELEQRQRRAETQRSDDNNNTGAGTTGLAMAGRTTGGTEQHLLQVSSGYNLR